MQRQAIQRIPVHSVCAVIALAFASLASAGQISLQWDDVPGATGYKIYVGHDTGDYFRSVNVGDKTWGTVYGLRDCKEFYIAVKAYNGSGESTRFSNEISGWPRPLIDGGEPVVMEQGSQYLVTLDGHNFMDGSELVFETVDVEGNPLVQVDSIDVVSCNRIQALVSVEPTAAGFRAMEVGSHEFRIRNPDRVFGTGDFEIRLDPQRLDINRSNLDTRDRVDGKDLVWMAFAHGASQGEDRFNADADLNGDGYVDGEDLAYLATEFGACWTGADWTHDDCNSGFAARNATRE